MKRGSVAHGPVDISRDRGGKSQGTMNPLFSSLHQNQNTQNTQNNQNNQNNQYSSNQNLQNQQNTRTSGEVTVLTTPTGGFKMRHESIGSQDSDNNSYNSSSTQELEPDDDSPNPPHGRFIRSLSEAMRPENFDLLSGDHQSKDWKNSGKAVGRGGGGSGGAECGLLHRLCS